MLKKEMLLKTAVCYWSAEDDCYVVESPFFPAVIAAEKTAKKALALYKSMLNSTYEEFLKDNVHGYKRGRPAKNGVELHVQVQAETKQTLDSLRQELGISQGEFIDLATFYYAKKAEATSVTSSLSLETTMSELFDALQARKNLPSRNQRLNRAAS